MDKINNCLWCKSSCTVNMFRECSHLNSESEFWYYVQCERCNARGPETAQLSMAIDEWNRVSIILSMHGDEV
jgi:hypothetical protein